MDTYQFIASLVSSLALPLAVIIVALIFRRQIGAFLGRIRKLDALGTHTEFDPEEAAPAVAEAAAKASEASEEAVTADKAGRPSGAPVESVPRHRGLFGQARSLIRDQPREAVAVAYKVVDDLLLRYMDIAGEATSGGSRHIDRARARNRPNQQRDG